MHAGCVIAGRVVRADGQPVAGGALERSGSDDEASASFVAAGALAADGAFVWSTADAMSVLLRAWPWRSPPSAARRFECTDGARFTDVVFVIPDAAPDLSGRVVTTDGRPVPFAFVDIRGEADVLPSQQERADADGAWAVYALPPGRYRVSSSADDGGAAIARVTAPADAVDLRLSGTGALEGEVAGLGDGPLTLTVVLYAQAADEIAVDLRRAVTVTRGRYRVDGLPAGELVLQFEQGERRTFLETEVAAGAHDLPRRRPPRHPRRRDRGGRRVRAPLLDRLFLVAVTGARAALLTEPAAAAVGRGAVFAAAVGVDGLRWQAGRAPPGVAVEVARCDQAGRVSVPAAGQLEPGAELVGREGGLGPRRQGRIEGDDQLGQPGLHLGDDRGLGLGQRLTDQLAREMRAPQDHARGRREVLVLTPRAGVALLLEGGERAGIRVGGGVGVEATAQGERGEGRDREGDAHGSSADHATRAVRAAAAPAPGICGHDRRFTRTGRRARRPGPR
jgi:hypothetical protein